MSDCSRHAFDVPQPKRLRLLEPQGSPDVIECDGVEYRPARTCAVVSRTYDRGNNRFHVYYHRCSACLGELPYMPDMGHSNFCPNCGAQVIEERREEE